MIQTAIDNPEFVYTANTPEVQAIIDKCRWRKHRSILGTPGKDPIKFINKHLHSVGIQTKSKRRKKNGRSYSVYLIDQEFLLSEERLAIYQAIQLKYEDQNNSHNKPKEWETDEQNSSQNNPLQESSLKMAENTERQGLESVTDSTSFYINNSRIYHPKNNQSTMANSNLETNNTKPNTKSI